MPEATDDSFTDGTEKTEDADGNYQVNIVRGEEFHIELNHEDGQYQPGETVVFSGDMPQGSLIAVGTTKSTGKPDREYRRFIVFRGDLSRRIG